MQLNRNFTNTALTYDKKQAAARSIGPGLVALSLMTPV